MNGVLIIDKPEDYTSHDVVARLRGILKTKKIGHTGTLDPFATGVLVMLIGKATRLARFLDKDEKTYEALLSFGFETDTGDRTGAQKGERQKEKVKKEDIENVLPLFLGNIEQTPPMYSAKKIKGKKLYELARKGIEVKREPVSITIDELSLTDADKLKSEQIASIRVKCSAGTYVRTLAEDIGRKLGIGCHLSQLRRTNAGKFDIAQALSLDKLEKKVAANELSEVLIPMSDAVSHLKAVNLDNEDVRKVGNGLKIGCEDSRIGYDEPLRLLDPVHGLVAIGYKSSHNELIEPRIVMV